MSNDFSREQSDLEPLLLLAREAMLKRGLAPHFPPAAIAQLNQISGPAYEPALKDLRSLPWCSIDNEDSQDLDQLTVAEAADGSGTRIRIALADVDALVAKGTPIDDHARFNTTSVYTPARIFSMLPERLSMGFTSLSASEDRVAIVISYTVGDDGAVTQPDIERALVRNQAKLTYNGVNAWLEGGPMPDEIGLVPELSDQLRLQDKVAQLLKVRRYRDGALDLESIDTRTVVAMGRVVGVRRERKNRARTLIEDFMIAANGVSARYLESNGLPSVRRVVRSPARWDRIVALARAVGEYLPSEPSSKELAQFLARRRTADPSQFPDLSLAIVKLLGRGEYVLTRSHEEETSHFGLAVRDYVHSTAPNRRFPDLITHRLMKAAIENSPSPYSEDELRQIALHCSKQEDAAAKVERQVKKSAAALFLSSRIGQRFEAVVTGASSKGTWVRIIDPPTEGRLVQGSEGLDVGDRLRVRLVSTDVERGFIDFERSPRISIRRAA